MVKKAKTNTAILSKIAMALGLLCKNLEIYTAIKACIIIMAPTPKLKIIPFVFPFSTLVLAALTFNKPGGKLAKNAAAKVAKKRIIRCCISLVIDYKTAVNST